MEELLKKWGFYDFLNKIGKDWYFTNLVYRKPLSETGSVLAYTYNRDPKISLVPCLTNKGTFITKGINSDFKVTRDSKLETYSGNGLSDAGRFNIIGYAKIKHCKDSVNLFGHLNMKSQMVYGFTNKEGVVSNNLYNISKVNTDYTCKDGIVRNIVEVTASNGKNLKFVEEDLEFVYPDLEKLMKGYTPKLDRTIKIDSKVKIAKKNNYNLAYGTKAQINNLIRAGNKKYCEIVTADNKKYLIAQSKLKVIQ